MTTTELDHSKVEAFAGQVIGIINGGALTQMLSIGHHTGLFDTILVTAHGEDAPAKMQPFGRVFQLFVKFASGWWRGAMA